MSELAKGEDFVYIQAECGECDRIFHVIGTLVEHQQTVHLEDAAKATPSGANAPYVIQKRGTKYVVVNNAGMTKATFKTKAAAKDYQDALYANVKGAAKRASKVPFTGKITDRVPPQKASKDMDDAKQFTAGERTAAAGTGAALPGGGFPIKTKADLKNAIQALGRAKNKVAAKAHIIKRAKALGATSSLPPSWKATSGDSAAAGRELWSCPEDECARAFSDEGGLFDHADAVHTFDDIRSAVGDACRDQFGRKGDYRAEPPIPSIYVWVSDLAEDWVVFCIDGDGSDSQLMKASYQMDDNGAVTLGAPVEVTRRTVYDAVGTARTAPIPTATVASS